MYFSMMTLKKDGARTGRPSPLLESEGYRLHQAIWNLFPADRDAGRDFLFRREDERRAGPRYYIVSAREPAPPDDAWALGVKPYEPRLTVGERLAFRLRANPVRTRQDADGRHHRHDVVMDAKCDLKREGVPREAWPPLYVLAHQAGLTWLRERCERHGFDFGEGAVRVENHQQHRFNKPGRTGGTEGRRVELSTLDFVGVLTVTDPERLTTALFSGIGPAKGFGCGLLLVRRV